MLEVIKGKDKINKWLENLLEKISFAIESLEEKKVLHIVKEVKEGGDKALIKYGQEFDKVNLQAKDLKVKEKEIDAAYKKVDTEFLSALRLAIKNITAYHEKEKIDEWFTTSAHDAVLGLRVLPIEKVGIYVPGGTAAYPSSVLMNAIPAKVAKVSQIIMLTPPNPSPYVLVAAREVGISEIYKVGGAQAIAALAFGTKTIPKVDKIVGPGNIYVTLAKKIVSGIVGIDKLAGPSELLIIADEDSEPSFIAADLLSQVEHDPDSFSILITDSEKIVTQTKKEVEKQAEKLARKKIIDKANIYIIVVDKLNQAVEIANQLAPEHLEILASPPQEYLSNIKNAGAVFLGPYSPAVIGDYLAGPNHVLPTGSTARFASPLGVWDFVKMQSIVGYTKPALKEIWKAAKKLAEIEGLTAHSRAIDVRFA